MTRFEWTRAFGRRGVAATALSAGLAFAPAAMAGAFYIQEQSVKGLGRAYSGEAADTGAESLWWNPAAIAGVEGIETMVGAQAITIDARNDDAGSTIKRPGQPISSVGGEPRAYNPVLFGVVPNSAAAWRINDHLALGFTVSAPFNAISKYSAASFARYDGEKSLFLSLDLQPTLAVRVNRFIDLGVGFDAQYFAATLTNAVANLSPLLPDGAQGVTADGWNYGFVLGGELHATDRLSFGASYRSAIRHDLAGRVTANLLAHTPYAQTLNTSGRVTFTTPWIATIGLRWKANDKLVLEAQAQHLGWSEFDKLAVSFTGGGGVTPENYRDTTSLSLGGEYDVTPSWTLRSGAQYDPTPTSSQYRQVRTPDSNRFLVSVGTTVRPRAHLSLDLAGGWIDFLGSHVHDPTNTFAGTPLSTPVTTLGSVSGSGAVLSAGARMTF